MGGWKFGPSESGASEASSVSPSASVGHPTCAPACFFIAAGNVPNLPKPASAFALLAFVGQASG